MAIELNEMKLTAYALGELYGAERAAVEAHVAESDEARRFVAEMRDTAQVVADELAHEPVVGLLAVHHAAIERQLEAVDHLPPLHIRRAPVQTWGTRVRHWAAFGLTAAASVLIVGGAIAVLAPQLYNPNGNRPLVHNENNKGQIFIPNYPANGVNPVTAPSVASLNAPNPFERPDAIQTDDGSRDVAAGPYFDPLANGDSRPHQNFNGGETPSPFGAPTTDAFPHAPVARGGAESHGDVAPVRTVGDGRGVENYARVIENPFVNVDESPLSTFAVDNESGSYAFVRRALRGGKLPSPGTVRVEEFLNYFPYDYEQPKGDAPFAANIEVADCPWNSEHRLVRVGLKAREIAPPEKRPAANLVFLVDVSDSMKDLNKLPLVKQGLKTLVDQLAPADRVAIVAYGGNAGLASLALPSTSAKEKQKVADALDTLTASGAAARGDEAVELAYKTAQPFVRNAGVSRVLLCTDGNFAATVNDQLRLVSLVDSKAKSNVFFSVLGFGAGRLNDPAMRALARRGNGQYALIDTQPEATRVLAEQASPAPGVVARDVKVQVEFNPIKAGAYRLIGYENRSPGDESSEENRDGRTVTSGHMVTALYEVVPAGKPVPGAEVFALKYQKRAPGVLQPTGSDEMLTLKVQYSTPDAKQQGQLMEFAVKDKGGKYAKATPDFKFAAAVTEFALILRGSEHRSNASLDRVQQMANDNLGPDRTGYRREFVDLVRKTREVRGG